MKEEYLSIETGINQGNISNCINGKRFSAGGFIWKSVRKLNGEDNE